MKIRWVLGVSMMVMAAGAAGCKKKEGAESSAAAPVAMAALDLSAAGVKATVQAPVGAKAKESFGNAEVTAGDAFQLQVSPSLANIAKLKKEIAANDMNKLKQFHVDAPDALLFESQMMSRTEFHFVANAGGFSCEDMKGPRVYSKADALRMLASCRTLAKK